MTIQGINLNFDSGPLHIERMAAQPYPDLMRVWARVQLSPFEAPPNVRLVCIDASGGVVAEMLLVEWRDPYISLTMHLRQPEPGSEYMLRAEVARDGQLLDSQETPFRLVFEETVGD